MGAFSASSRHLIASFTKACVARLAGLLQLVACAHTAQEGFGTSGVVEAASGPMYEYKFTPNKGIITCFCRGCWAG